MRGKRCVLLAIGFLLGALFLFETDARERVLKQFEQDRTQLEVLAQLAATQGTAQDLEVPKGWKSIEVYHADNDLITVEFCYASFGIVPSSTYWGINYIPCDKMLGFQGTGWDYWEQQGEGRLYYDPEGDNTCYVEKLDRGWYYFKASF